MIPLRLEIVMFLLVGTLEEQPLDLEIYVSVAGGRSESSAPNTLLARLDMNLAPQKAFCYLALLLRHMLHQSSMIFIVLCL